MTGRKFDLSPFLNILKYIYFIYLHNKPYQTSFPESQQISPENYLFPPHQCGKLDSY